MALLTLFGSPVVGIGSILFTLLMVLILLCNSSSDLKVAKKYIWKWGKSEDKNIPPSYTRRPAPWQGHQLWSHVPVAGTLGRSPGLRCSLIRQHQLYWCSVKIWQHQLHLCSVNSTSWGFMELGITRSAALTSRSHLPVLCSQRIASK